MKDNLQTTPAEDVTRQPYIKPAIAHELRLETRAGTPLGMPDPLGIDPTKPQG